MGNCTDKLVNEIKEGFTFKQEGEEYKQLTLKYIFNKRPVPNYELIENIYETVELISPIGKKLLIYNNEIGEIKFIYFSRNEIDIEQKIKETNEHLFYILCNYNTGVSMSCAIKNMMKNDGFEIFLC